MLGVRASPYSGGHIQQKVAINRRRERAENSAKNVSAGLVISIPPLNSWKNLNIFEASLRVTQSVPLRLPRGVLEQFPNERYRESTLQDVRSCVSGYLRFGVVTTVIYSDDDRHGANVAARC